MSSTATQVDIYNMALAAIGESPTIASVGESSTNADLCNLFWPTVRDDLLQAAVWGFATRRADLTAITPFPEPLLYQHWQYLYAVPTECLRVLNLYPETQDDAGDANETPHDYIIELSAGGARHLYCNVENAVLHYVERIADVTAYSPQFVSAVVHKLAAELAGAIIKGDEGEAVARRERQLADMLAKRAASNDASQFRDHDRGILNYMPEHLRGR